MLNIYMNSILARQCYRPILGAGLSASRPVPKTNNTPILSLRLYQTTGEAVKWQDFAKGDLGGRGVFLDTNILPLILEGDRVHIKRWLEDVQSRGSEVATCHFNLIEYLSSSWSIRQGQEPGKVISELQKRSVRILPGLSSTRASMKLACSTISAQLLHTLDACKTLSPEKREDKSDGTLGDWGGILKSSRDDVILACEAHKHGLAFLTADKKMYKQFGFALNKNGITTYMVTAAWMESGMNDPPS
ncbi:hypothetical protein TWF192_000945 [Orbilia oligospora]|uniref:PIN domain-containing protein n=1 Tax=Orbilia oligospora TaxID=2813651 RepID=A0A6G1MGN8_ORBOL|nr:hypothetical protein TWF191_005572 [Orbilia oligospora]KAF3257655.1 hypothetical protein TWF192_000945 [Orbilia oligospora]